MWHKVRTWLLRFFQAIKIWAFRLTYRVSSARTWRGSGYDAPHTDRPIQAGDITLTARLYANEKGAQKPVIVFFHGGGWVIGDLESHHPFCQALSTHSGCSVISVDYRLAPEHPFPAAHDDCLAATRWLAEHATELVPGNGKLVLAGESAGGNLATCTCLEIDGVARENIVGELLIDAATAHYSAGFDSYTEHANDQALTATILLWFWDTYLGQLAADDPTAQRAYPLRSSHIASLPPTLLVTAEKDPLQGEGKAYAEQLRQAGVPLTYYHFENAEHTFACSQGPNPDALTLLDHVNTWLAQLD